MPNWNDPTWWRLQRQLFAQESTELVMDIVLMGGAAGADMLPPGYQVLVDWDMFNEDAIRFLHNYLAVDKPPGDKVYWLNSINETSRKQTVTAIDEWIRSGAPLPALEKQLEAVYGKARASRIATTEVTRLYAESNQLAWKSAGVYGKRWMTAVDDRVCPI